MKIETKFNVGDDCFYMEDNKVKKNVITNINTYTSVGTYSYNWDEDTTIDYLVACGKCTRGHRCIDGVHKPTKSLFATKQELLNSL